MTEHAPIPEGTLIVVADGGSARVFTNVGSKTELKLKQQDELVLRDVSARTQDVMLGFAAGMMLAASAFSLLLPGIEAGTELFQSDTLGALVVVFGMSLGVLLMLVPIALRVHLASSRTTPRVASQDEKDQATMQKQTPARG